MSLLGALTDFMASGVEALGYPGIFVFMFVEGVITPIPSMVILPFAGYLASQGILSVPLVILVASIAAMTGSGGAYYLGQRLGRPFVRRWGRYVFLDEADLEHGEAWFRKHGSLGIFLANCFPGSRSIVAYPAGAARMPFTPFLVATFFGALIWNSVLTFAGLSFGLAWKTFVDTFELVDIAAFAGAFAGIGIWIWYKKRAPIAKLQTP